MALVGPLLVGVLIYGLSATWLWNVGWTAPPLLGLVGVAARLRIAWWLLLFYAVLNALAWAADYRFLTEDTTNFALALTSLVALLALWSPQLRRYVRSRSAPPAVVS